jgi:hypothetical protein
MNELYDVRTNPIYIASRQELVAAQLPKIKIVPKSKIAKITRDPRVDTVFVLGKGGKRPTVVTTEQGAKRLREQLAQGGQEPADGQVGDPFRAEILALLKSGRALISRGAHADPLLSYVALKRDQPLEKR